MTRLTITKNKILNESLRLFGEKGYFDTTTKEIAKCCGINESTLFRHYKDKESLFKKVISEFINQPLEEFDAVENDLHFTDCYQDHLALASAYIQTVFSKLYIIRILVSKIAITPEIKIDSRFPLYEMKNNYHAYLIRAMEHDLIPHRDYDVEEGLFVSYIMRLVLDIAAHKQIYTLTEETHRQLTEQLQKWCLLYVDKFLNKSDLNITGKN